MCVVFRRDMDVSSKNPASGVDPRRVATWARRQGVLSLGHLSLHKQRKVCSRAEGGRKPLILILILILVAVAVAVGARARARAFTPLRGASYFSLLVQRKDNQKKAHPAYAPTSLRDAGSLRQRDFSTRHPCRGEKRRASMHVALRVLPTGSVAAEGARWVNVKGRSNDNSKSYPFPALPLPAAKGGGEAAIGEGGSGAAPLCRQNKSGVAASHRPGFQSTEHRNAARLFSR